MDQKEFERVTGVVNKYNSFLMALPGLMCLAYNDKEIKIEVKPEKVELTKQFVASILDGVPVVVISRNNPPSF